MSAADLDKATINQLRPLAADRVSVLLGAGASAGAGLPGWDALARDLLVRSGAVGNHTEASTFLARQDAILAAEAAKAATSDFASLLRQTLYDGPTAPEPAVLHLAAAALAARHNPGTVQLHTLNFDTLLGDALRLALAESGIKAEVHERAESRQGPPDAYVVNHLHGILPPDPAAPDRGIVLTLSDFARLGAEPHPWQVAALQDSIQKGPLILAGTSYRDPDIRQWLHSTHKDHEVAVLLAREAIGLDRATFERLKPALENQWTAIGVRPVTLHDHADAAQALRELPHLCEPDYRSPQERAATVWAQQASKFRWGQQFHNQQLQDHVDQLRPHLGDEANLTLWIADGCGRLVRWSAPDRTYVDPAQLRRVEVGHDSAWVAGQCLGRDDVLAADLDGPRGATQRWRSVVAAPITVEVDGGPAFSSAVLTSASPRTLKELDADAWQQELLELASQWGDLLSLI
ncbi:SIR2 family protein [Cellulomonas sp. HD19AZ1]|uniref:SIR2 family protein n=1 Tax=Cellulomonas sp. HD19AZ1 TaxID=2559593 RepID=UPI00142F6A95|nr:SIR2 family protein [Cellulomonas sp. HD19AZ1]